MAGRIKFVSRKSGPYDDSCHEDWRSMVIKLDRLDRHPAETHWHTWRRTLVADCGRFRPTVLFNPTWDDRLMNSLYALLELITDTVII